MAFYQYESIPTPANLEYTRVLNLAPGEPSDPLIGSLTSLSVVDPEPFEALSYVWGRSGRETIECDGKTIVITSTLAIALRRLRSTTYTRTVWVDQVCINQQDLTERSQQVRHMNSIYQKAAKVVVWLGDDAEGDAERAFALMKSLVAISEDPLLLEQFQAKQADGELDWFPASYWVSLGKLFKRPWFDRKWILQEIGTDAASQLLWGDADLDWSYVSKAAVLLKEHGYALRRQYDLLVWKPWYMDKLFSRSAYKTKALNFVYELHRARWQLSSDPRDHIFALLGHPSAQEGPYGLRVIEADYTKSVEEVYHDLVVRMLKKGDSLMILNTVQHGSSPLGSGPRNVPTWVTQWDSQESLHNLLGDDTCVYKPSRDVAPQVTFLEADRILSIDGIVVDEIAYLSDGFDNSDLSLASPTVGELWGHLSESGAKGFTTKSQYVTGKPALFAFLETISAVKKRKAQAPIPESQRLADGTDFLVKAYGETGLIGDDVREMARIGNCYNWMERASGGAKCRRFARGQRGHYALCPPAAAIGDVLCLLLGGQTLFCLRPVGGEYLFVGECYVHGLMEGEGVAMMEDGVSARTTFMIR